VIVQLLNDFSPNCAAVTYDAIRKPEDFRYFPENDPLRRNVFRPLWHDSGRGFLGLPSKNEIRCFVSSEEWYKAAGQMPSFFSRLDQNAVLLLEHVVGTGVASSSQIAQQRVAAYQYVDEFVTRHRESAPDFPEIRRVPRPIPIDPNVLGPEKDSAKEKRRLVKPRMTVKPQPRVSLPRIKNRPETVHLEFSAYLELGKFRECRISFDAVLKELNDSFFAFWLSDDGKIRVRCEDNLAQKGGRLVRITGRVVDIEGELVVDIKSADDIALVEPNEVISDRNYKKRSVVENTQLLRWNFRAFPGWKRRPRRLPPPPRATLPRRPESLRGELIGTKVTLTWQEPNYNGVAIMGYLIEQSRDGGEWSPIDDVAAQPCEKTIVDLERGVDYRFCVSAEGAAGFGSRSEPFHLGLIPETANTLPGRPESLEGELIGRKVRLTWREPNYNGVVIVGYRIEQSRDGGGWSLVDDVAAQPCEKTIVDLERGVDYRFCVSAEGAAGLGSRSEPFHLGLIDERDGGDFENDSSVERVRLSKLVAVSGAVIALVAILIWFLR
jgi:hypothetical protein